jgi:glucose-1-phosphate thymidylyltransferase
VQGIVLAAGSGTRLTPLTSAIPKALIPVGNQPLIEYVLKPLELAGLTEVKIVTGHIGCKVEKYVKTSRRHKGVEFSCIRADNYEAGPIHSFLAAEESIDDDFLLTPVDLVLKPDIVRDLVRNHERDGVLHVAAGSSYPQTPRGSMLVCSLGVGANAGSVVKLQESEMTSAKRGSNQKVSVRTSIGVVICPKILFKYAHAVAKSGSTKVIDALNRYISETGRARYMTIGSRDYCFDVDDFHTLLGANRFILRNSLITDKALGRFYPNNSISPVGSKLLDYHSPTSSTIIGPAVIGKRSKVKEGSTIGPYVSIQDNCKIGRDVRCENTIVLSDSQVGDGKIIENAVIFGRDIIDATIGTSHVVR